MADERDVKGEMLIRREERKLERAREKAEAYEKNMEKTIADLLKQESVKKALAKDAMEATRDQTRRTELFEKAGSGMFKKDDEIITGEFESTRPWED